MPGAKEQAALAESGDEEPGDPRLRLLGTFVARSLRPAAGTWERCAGTAEAGRLLQAFLDHNAASDPRPLLVVQSGPGGLVVTPGLDAGPEPSRARAKGLFFLRTKSEPPGNHSLRGTVLCGDLPAVPLEHLAPLLSEVIIPVLANEKNHLEWPHMVCQDIRHHAHTLKSDLLVIFEHMKGRTLLPLPVGSEKLEFVDGHSEPVCEDLEHIYNQLMTIKVKGMAELLDKLQSSYLPAFKAMFRDVEAAFF